LLSNINCTKVKLTNRSTLTQNTLAYIWGTALLPADETVRPDFVGVPRYSVWVGGTEPVTRPQDNRLRAIVGPGLSAFGLAATAGAAVGMIIHRAKFYAVVLTTDSAPPHPGWLSGGAVSLGAAAALAAVGMGPIYAWATERIVEFENYKTQVTLFALHHFDLGKHVTTYFGRQ